jgi:uncharacterized damage-inducible protein DinB
MIGTCTKPASHALSRQLLELAQVLRGLTDQQYATTPVGVIPGSVGAHVRHTLDHVQALLAAADTGELDYEHRRRGGAIEQDRSAALALIDQLAAALEHRADFDRTVIIGIMLSPAGQATRIPSTFVRETAYVISHTIHHSAIIGAMVRTLGGEMPAFFGYAPSTVAHLRQD